MPSLCGSKPPSGDRPSRLLVPARLPGIVPLEMLARVLLDELRMTIRNGPSMKDLAMSRLARVRFRPPDPHPAHSRRRQLAAVVRADMIGYGTPYTSIAVVSRLPEPDARVNPLAGDGLSV